MWNCRQDTALHSWHYISCDNCYPFNTKTKKKKKKNQAQFPRVRGGGNSPSGGIYLSYFLDFGAPFAYKGATLTGRYNQPDGDRRLGQVAVLMRIQYVLQNNPRQLQHTSVYLAEQTTVAFNRLRTHLVAMGTTVRLPWVTTPRHHFWLIATINFNCNCYGVGVGHCHGLPLQISDKS